MFKLLAASALVASAIAQQIGTTTNCATCQYWGGNWCQFGAAQNQCWRNTTIAQCTTMITTPVNCPGISQCASVAAHSDDYLGTTTLSYTLPQGGFCVVNATNHADDDLELKITTPLSYNVVGTFDPAW